VNVREQRLQRANLECVLHRLKLHCPAGRAEAATIRGLWRTAQQHSANAVLLLSGARIITSGWAAWCRTTQDGRRVIFLLLMPGDIITPSIGAGGAGGDLVALTRLCSVDASGPDLSGDAAPVARAWIAGADAEYRARLLDHLAWLNEGSALRNLARLLLELSERAHAAGRRADGRFDLPIGQRVLAQALGLSAVQVNKVMQQLREANLLTSERGWLRIDDEDALRTLAHGAPARRSFPRAAAATYSAAGTPAAE
jgi:CRP-like cAMP-binding protein